MSIKIAVDNNFFDNYVTYPNNETKQIIKRAFTHKYLAFYPTIELFSELISLYHTSRRSLLMKYCPLFLDMMGYRFFKTWNEIVRMELGIEKNTGVFLDSSTVKNIKLLLEELSYSQKPDNIKEMLKWVKDHKGNMHNFYKKTKVCNLKFLKNEAQPKDIKQISKMSLEDLNKMGAVTKWMKDIAKDVFSKAGKHVSKKGIDGIIKSPKKYPYFHTYLRLEIALNHYHTFLQRKVERGDSYDLYQLIYLIKLDYFVTNDRKLKSLADYVFSGSNKAINFNQLALLVQKKRL